MKINLISTCDLEFASNPRRRFDVTAEVKNTLLFWLCSCIPVSRNGKLNTALL